MKLEDKILQLKRSEDSSWHKARIGQYHASQIYKICEGEIRSEDYFKKEELTDKSIFNFFIGTMYHDAVQKLFPKNQREIECRIDIAEDVQIIGRCDLNLEVPVELKTCSSFPNVPWPSHVYQLNCYLHALGKDKGYITYIRKDAQEIKTVDFPVEYDKTLQDYINLKTLEFHKSLLKLKEK